MNNLTNQWFSLKNLSIQAFQEEALKSILKGDSGLIVSPTGAGKTYAAFLPSLEKVLSCNRQKGIKILYITPLKALAKDLETALLNPIIDLNLPLKIERRTSDTSYALKKKQLKNPPDILLTTPESLSLMLTENGCDEFFKNIQIVIVDEWHEFLSSKRGVLVELNLSRLKKFNPHLQIWGLTATIANKELAATVCCGLDKKPVIISSTAKREIIVHSILPKSINEIPWSGFLGLKMLHEVLQYLDIRHSTLIFANTRSQAEKWFQKILENRPLWKNIIALHHSSIDKKERLIVEDGMKSGLLKITICTSSLDLGIDFPLVDRVIQLGSPKSISRLIQRAGRSSHRPLTPCHIAIVPTNAMELIEIKAYKKAINQHLVEERVPLKNCYDVLIQHLTTCAIGGGFKKLEIFREVKNTFSFSLLSFEDYEKCLDFLVSGGSALSAYSEYKKMIQNDDFYYIDDKSIISRHKMNIGTIISDSLAQVKLMRGKTIGMIEESFLSSIKPGDSFLFAGKFLQLKQYKDLIAHVALSDKKSIQTVSWKGGRLPYSAPLAKFLREEIHSPHEASDKESILIKNVLDLQKLVSLVPLENELLVETLKSRDGYHLFIYPFEGKTVHEGLARIISHRLSLLNPKTLTLSFNDYGLELLSSEPFDLKLMTNDLFSTKDVKKEYEELINIHESAKSIFREIASIAGLIFQGYPNKNKSSRQLNLSSGVLFEVLQKYDPQNILLLQAKKQVFEKQFENEHFIQVLKRLSKTNLIIKELKKFSPFSLPLYIERVAETISTESLEERIKKITGSWG